MHIIILIIIIFILLFYTDISISKFNKYNEHNKYHNAILCIPQGWTDIFNCLGLINFYSKKYIKLYLVIRDDSKELINFYIKNLNNIELIFINNKKFIKGRYGNDWLIYKFIKKYYSINNCEQIFIGFVDYDNTRYDFNINLLKSIFTNFEINLPKCYYETYNIPYSVRINNFIFYRDYKLENLKYNNFIKENGYKYILYHSNNNNIDFIINKKNIKYINLNKKSNIFFDYIKILENSIEFHLIDSSWALFIYLLDAKYGLFKKKKIYLYARRNYSCFFKEPLLDNWIFIKEKFLNLIINLYQESFIGDYFKYK
jgi:hypothetical protein